MIAARMVLAKQGHEVTSRWIDGNHQIDDNGLSAEAKHVERIRFATEDWEDLLAADWLIAFTELPRSHPSRGGRHVELGAALALAKRIIIVGPAENVFCCLPQIERVDTWFEFLGLIGIKD